MKYVKAIFENENVQSLATSNEELINYATECLINYNASLESDILENLLDYTVEGDLAATYENIRNTVVNANVSFMQEVSSVLASPDLSIEEKVAYLDEANKMTNKKRYDAKLSTQAKRAYNSFKRNVSSATDKVKDTAKNVGSKAKDATNSGFDKLGKVGMSSYDSKYTATPESIRKLGKKRAAIGAGAVGGLAAAGLGKAVYDRENESLAEKAARAVKG